MKKHIRELLGQTTDTELEVENLALAALAPELAADWIRLRKELNELVEELNYTAICSGRQIATHVENILNKEANN